jgi:ketosteroid isomerase-like protein
LRFWQASCKLSPLKQRSLKVCSLKLLRVPRQQISSVLDEWAKDWKARDADAIAGLYAQDAVIYTASARIDPRDTIGDFPGPNAVRNYFKQFFDRLADPKIGDFVVPNHPQSSQDLAFDDGLLQYLMRGKCRPEDIGDGPCVIKGFFSVVLKRSSDGRWLIALQSFPQMGQKGSGSTIYTPH